MDTMTDTEVAELEAHLTELESDMLDRIEFSTGGSREWDLEG
jgi:hypothetical protein